MRKQKPIVIENANVVIDSNVVIRAPKRFTVTFSNVGRHRKSWVLECDETTYHTFMRSIRQNQALMSREVEFMFANVPREAGDTAEGFIDSGGRAVGKFHIKQNR